MLCSLCPLPSPGRCAQAKDTCDVNPEMNHDRQCYRKQANKNTGMAAAYRDHDQASIFSVHVLHRRPVANNRVTALAKVTQALCQHRNRTTQRKCDQWDGRESNASPGIASAKVKRPGCVSRAVLSDRTWWSGWREDFDPGSGGLLMSTAQRLWAHGLADGRVTYHHCKHAYLCAQT